MATKVLCESIFNGQVVRLTLNAPKANILDSFMMADLQRELTALRTQHGVKLIQFAATGENFSFGASVAEHTRDRADAMLTQFHALFLDLADLGIATAAMVTGQCLGGAMEFVTMCNFLFIDRTAQLGQPEIMLGVYPPPASVMLPLKIGQTRADEIILTGRSLSADEAISYGLATACFEDKNSLEEGVADWVNKHILPKSASSLQFAVRAARFHFNQQLREQLSQLQELYVSELMATHDANEGIESFLAKRKPVWQNR